MQENIRIQTT